MNTQPEELKKIPHSSIPDNENLKVLKKTVLSQIRKYKDRKSLVNQNLQTHFNQLYYKLSKNDAKIEEFLTQEIANLKENIEKELEKHIDNNGNYLQNPKYSSLVVRKMGKIYNTITNHSQDYSSNLLETLDINNKS